MQAATKFTLIALALAATPSLGAAQSETTSDRAGLLSRFGEYALVGGGVTDLADDDAKDRFDVGGAWDLRLGVGSRFFVGGEIAYVGSMRGASSGGSDLLSNGAEAVVRVQYPYATGRWLVEPFAFGGIGWTHLSLEDAAPGLLDSDDIGVVPFGAGVTLGRDRLLLDARFTYRTSFDEDLALSTGASPASLDQWGVTASIGYEF